MKQIYRSSIPSTASERVIQRHPNGSKYICHYFLKRKKVGVRFFSKDGDLEMEYGIKNRKVHGKHFEWESGKLMFEESIIKGLAHGTAKQWSRVTGKLIGSFKMNKGNGIDLWWHDWPGRPYLSDAIFLRNGIPHGFEWLFNSNEKSIFSERHWFNGKWHGIFRKWKDSRTLDKGFPKFYIKNKQISKEKYIKASEKDPTLPKYNSEDNLWYRDFPSALKPHFRRKVLNKFKS